jgi:hypothetical protein
MDSVAGAKARLSTLFDTVYLEGKTSAVSYTVDIDAYVTSDKSEFDGLGPSASAEKRRKALITRWINRS